MNLFAAADPAAAVVLVTLIGVVTLTLRTRRFAQRNDTTDLERALFMTTAAEAMMRTHLDAEGDSERDTLDLTESVDLTDPRDPAVSSETRSTVDLRDQIDIREVPDHSAPSDDQGQDRD